MSNRIIDWQAQCPVVDGDRVYYSQRDDNGFSRTCCIVIGNKNYFGNDILPLGLPGTFDEHGIMPTCIIDVGSEKYLYYIGWSKRVSVPYSNAIGLAISKDGGNTWKKYSDGPVIGQDAIDPYFTGTCWVRKNTTRYEAYYMSCVGWHNGDPMYDIKLAVSYDGKDWIKGGDVVLPLKEWEGGICSVTIHENRMWYCYRGKEDFRGGVMSYRIGNAELINGRWVRKDDFKLPQSDWDNEMQCYPYVVKRDDKLLMFYNGNGFGNTGIGYAEIR